MRGGRIYIIFPTNFVIFKSFRFFRYDNVVHMVSAAVGAEDFYTVEDHSARFEGLEMARERDRRAMEAWDQHPYVDIVDNRGNFDSKVST